jgi:hypothetical protein
VITEAHVIPLAVSLTGGPRNDVTQLTALIADAGLGEQDVLDSPG